jgi:hypothetical protein
MPVPQLHRYYGFLRPLLARPGRLRSPLTTRYRASAETRRSPTFAGNPSESVLRARDSGGSREPRLTVPAILPSVRLTTSASATRKDFGAESARPAPLLSTLHLAGRPARRKTRYRPARYSVDRAGFTPAGLLQEVSRAHHVSSSSAPRGAVAWMSTDLNSPNAV